MITPLPCPLCGKVPTKFVLITVCALGATNDVDDEITFTGDCCGRLELRFDLPVSEWSKYEEYMPYIWNTRKRCEIIRGQQ